MDGYSAHGRRSFGGGKGFCTHTHLLAILVLHCFKSMDRRSGLIQHLVRSSDGWDCRSIFFLFFCSLVVGGSGGVERWSVLLQDG